jgi:hypothetical protein
MQQKFEMLVALQLTSIFHQNPFLDATITMLHVP